MNTHSPVNGATYLTLDVLYQYENGGEAGRRGLIVAGCPCGMVGTAFFCARLGGASAAGLCGAEVR